MIRQISQPPCEAVSWNELKNALVNGDCLSASLWGCELKCGQTDQTDESRSQPPCEAVSWNVSEFFICFPQRWSASLRGCELKYQLSPYEQYLLHVSLLVRLWVEMTKRRNWQANNRVSLLERLWVEIKQATKLNRVRIVSLLERLWVEMPVPHRAPDARMCQPPWEAVSWNTDPLKFPPIHASQPPWVLKCLFGYAIIDTILVSLFERLWIEKRNTVSLL